MADDHRADDVGTRVVAEAVAGSGAAVVDRLLLGRALRVDDRLERLVGDADPLRGPTCLLRMLGSDDRDRLAEVADALDRKHRLVGELEPVRLRARDVCMREHGVDSGHADGFRDVELLDQRVRVRAADRVSPEHPGGEEVARVGELPRHLRDRVDALDTLADPAKLERASGRVHSGRVLVPGTGARPERTAGREFGMAVCRENGRIGPGLRSGTGARLEETVMSRPPA